jgi:hypothetical protein
MKEQKTPQTQKNNQPIKKLEIGKFYLIHDGSQIGHPGLIVWKSDDANLYLAIKFGTTKTKNNIRFKYPIEKNIKVSFVFKRFFLGKRKDFGSKELTRLVVLQDDLNVLMNNMDKNNPLVSTNIKGRHLHTYRFLIKNCHRST